MLLGDLYTINNLQILENSSLLAKIGINGKHPILKGHFPGHPVMPGVCLTNMVTETLSAFLKQEYFLSSADYIKFIQLVIPEKTTELSASLRILEQASGLIRIEASLSDENTTFLKLKGNFSPKMF